MTNNNFNALIGYFAYTSNLTLNTLSKLKVLKYDGTGLIDRANDTMVTLASCINVAGVFGEANQTSSDGTFLTLGTDNTPPTKSDLKLGNSIEDFVWLSGGRVTGIEGDAKDLLMFNSVVNYRGSSPITIKEMGLNCVISNGIVAGNNNGQKFLLARETIEPLVINPNDTYSFIMRIK